MQVRVCVRAHSRAGSRDKKSMHMSSVQSGCMTAVCVKTHSSDRVLGKPKSRSSVRQIVAALCGYCIFLAGIPVKTLRPALPACHCGHAAIGGRLRRAARDLAQALQGN